MGNTLPLRCSVVYVAIGGVLSAASRAVACPGRVRHRGGSPSHVDPPAEIDRFEMADPHRRRGAGRAAVAGRRATRMTRTPKPAPGRMFVVGRVLDPEGKPVPGAMIMVYARSLMVGRAALSVAKDADPDR